MSRASGGVTGTRQVAGRAAIVRGTTQRQGRGQAIALTAWRHPGKRTNTYAHTGTVRIYGYVEIEELKEDERNTASHCRNKMF